MRFEARLLEPTKRPSSRSTRRTLIAVCFVFSVVAFSWVAVSAQSKQAPAASDISGIWRLNADLSDKAPTPGDAGGQRQGREGNEGGGRHGGGGGFGGPGGGGMGGMRGGMGGMRGGPGGPGGQRDPEQMKKMCDFMQAALGGPNAVTIVQHDNEISFTDDQGQVTKIAPDGKEEKHVFGSETGKTKTKWTNGELVMEIASTDGNAPKIQRTYSLVQGPDGAKQLRVVSKIEGTGDRGPGGPGGGGGSREFVRVYDPGNP